jgi:hypothetical protein
MSQPRLVPRVPRCLCNAQSRFGRIETGEFAAAADILDFPLQSKGCTERQRFAARLCNVCIDACGLDTRIVRQCFRNRLLQVQRHRIVGSTRRCHDTASRYKEKHQQYLHGRCLAVSHVQRPGLIQD